jgi:hypothetical protein
MEASTRKRDLGPLTGALFVVLVLVAFFAVGGNTPDGDASAQKVSSFYHHHGDKQIAAAVILALSAVPLMYFTALLRDRLQAALPGRSLLPGFALAGGAVAAAGFVTAAALHFALADYGNNIQPSAAQAINAIDNDFFLPFTTGLAVLLLAASAGAIRTGVLPKWMGWVGVVLFVVFFTPLGFIAFGLSGIWIIVVSVILYLRGTTVPATSPGSPA